MNPIEKQLSKKTAKEFPHLNKRIIIIDIFVHAQMRAQVFHECAEGLKKFGNIQALNKYTSRFVSALLKKKEKNPQPLVFPHVLCLAFKRSTSIGYCQSHDQ